MTSNNEKKLLTKSDINRVFWRSFTVNASFNYERQMSQGAQYALSPILQKLYPDKKELGEALQRHAEFFNTTPMLCPFIFGITAAMEEENATQEDFDPNTINSVKAGLMGPLAGIGDSVFWGTLRPLAGGIACSLALTGNLFAPFLFLLLLFQFCNIQFHLYKCHIKGDQIVSFFYIITLRNVNLLNDHIFIHIYILRNICGDGSIQRCFRIPVCHKVADTCYRYFCHLGFFYMHKTCINTS